MNIEMGKKNFDRRQPHAEASAAGEHIARIEELSKMETGTLLQVYEAAVRAFVARELAAGTTGEQIQKFYEATSAAELRTVGSGEITVPDTFHPSKEREELVELTHALRRQLPRKDWALVWDSYFIDALSEAGAIEAPAEENSESVH